MAQPELRLLLIEDNPGDADLVQEALASAGGVPFQVHCATALLPGLDRLARGDIDLVLLDLSLPDSQGLDGLNAIRVHAPSVPVVLLTGFDSEALALRAVQSGAQEYLVKGMLQGPALARALQHAIVRQRIQAESSRHDVRSEQAAVVGILGAKGGVGSTTIACHLGMELKRQTGSRVLMMDLDLGGNALAFLMNVKAPYTIADASEDILHLDEDRWEKLVASTAEGLDVIQSAGPACREGALPKVERVRFALRFVRSLYRWVVLDLGRLSPFSALLCEEASRLYLVSTCDILGLSETKSVVSTLLQAGIDRDCLALILNQSPARTVFSQKELEKLLSIPVAGILPECRQDFEDSALDGKPLGQSRKFQKHIAEFASAISGEKESIPERKGRVPFLMGAFRNATADN